jgi:hypothetical protein
MIGTHRTCKCGAVYDRSEHIAEAREISSTVLMDGCVGSSHGRQNRECGRLGRSTAKLGEGFLVALDEESRRREPAPSPLIVRTNQDSDARI